MCVLNLNLSYIYIWKIDSFIYVVEIIQPRIGEWAEVCRVVDLRLKELADLLPTSVAGALA